MLAFLAWIVSVAFLALGTWREGKRRSWAGVYLCAMLGAAFLVSVPITFIDPPRFMFFAIVECFTIWAAARIWDKWGDWRAPVIAVTGLAKLSLRYGASKGWFPESDAYAACLNGAFLVQCLVAGGMFDGLVAWLGDRRRALAAGRGRVHRHGEA